MGYNPIRNHAMAWEAGAIDKCRADPELVAQETAGDLCIPCMMPHPCLCDKNKTLPKMREYYEANRRSEPVLNMNWGVKGDGLMTGLYQIASEPFRKEIARLRAKLDERKV